MQQKKIHPDEVTSGVPEVWIHVTAVQSQRVGLLRSQELTALLSGSPPSSPSFKARSFTSRSLFCVSESSFHLLKFALENKQ